MWKICLKHNLQDVSHSNGPMLQTQSDAMDILLYAFCFFGISGQSNAPKITSASNGNSYCIKLQ